MYERIWTSNFGSIGFVDSAKVIKDIYGSEFFSKNVGGIISKSTESKAEVKFIFQGPPLSKGVTSNIVFTEVGYTQKSTSHKMVSTGYKYLNGNHQFEYQSREKIKFAGNSRFNAELQIVDETGFVRGRESTFFTYGYKMKWLCSLGILGASSVRTGAKLSLKTAITGFNLTNLYTDLLPVEKGDKASFLKNFFKSPEFIAERGLAAIEVIEESDGNVNFKIYIQDQALDIGKELTESFSKKVREREI
jgi:hypothetical protein